MSLVIGYKQNGVVYLGADTQTTTSDSYEKQNGLSTSNLKIVQFPNGMLLGAAGKVLSAQHVTAHPEWFTLPEDGVLTKEHIVTQIIPHIFACFRENDLFSKNNQEDPLCASNRFLLAHKDKLFLICSRLGVVVIENYAAIGSGEDFVLYGLSRLDASKPARAQIKSLLRIGAEFSPSVSAPFVLIDTATNKFKIER